FARAADALAQIGALVGDDVGAEVVDHLGLVTLALLAEHDVEFGGRSTAAAVAVKVEEDDARAGRIREEMRAVQHSGHKTPMELLVDGRTSACRIDARGAGLLSIIVGS